jgi:hypothetical protein
VVQLIASNKIFAPKSLGFFSLPLGLPAVITGTTQKEVLGNVEAPMDITATVISETVLLAVKNVQLSLAISSVFKSYFYGRKRFCCSSCR